MALKEKVADFTKETTFHGVKYVFDGTARKSRRCIWIFCVVTAMILFTYQVSRRIAVYFDYDTTVTVDIEYPDTVPFPTVTLCNMNSFRISFAGYHSWYDCIEEIFSGRNVTKSDCYQRNETVSITREFFDKVAHQMEDFIYMCTWKGRQCNLNEMFEPVWTGVGLCYSFNSGHKHLLATETGAGQGLRLTLNIESDEYMAGPLSGSGALVLLHDPSEAPLMRDLAYALAPGTHNLLAVKYTEIRDLEHPYGNCTSDAPPISRCIANCSSTEAEADCKCKDVMRDKTSGSCDVLRTLCILKQKVSQTLGAKSCGCKIPCLTNIYEATISNSLLDTHKLKSEIMTKTKSQTLLPNYRRSIEMSEQVKPELTKEDDDLINEVINQTSNLKRIAEDMKAYFTDDESDDIADILIKDVCSVFSRTYMEISDVLLQKINHTEELIRKIPDLTPFDLFAVKACGYNCLQYCTQGIPTLLLVEWWRCLKDERRMNTTGTDITDDYVLSNFSGSQEDFFSKNDDHLKPLIERASCNAIRNVSMYMLTLLYEEFFTDNTADNNSEMGVNNTTSNNNSNNNSSSSNNINLSELLQDYEAALHNVTKNIELDNSPGSSTQALAMAAELCSVSLEQYTNLTRVFLELHAVTSETTTDDLNLALQIETLARHIYTFSPVSVVTMNCAWYRHFMWWKYGALNSVNTMTVMTKCNITSFGKEASESSDSDEKDDTTFIPNVNQIRDFSAIGSGNGTASYPSIWMQPNIRCISPEGATATPAYAPAPAGQPGPAGPAGPQTSSKVQNGPPGTYGYSGASGTNQVYASTGQGYSYYSQVTQTFDFTQITDPDNPIYDDENRVKCFSHPVGPATVVTLIPHVYKSYLDVLEDNVAYQAGRPDGVLKSLVKYKEHLLNFSKANFAHNVLATEFGKIPDDLHYYKARFQQSFDVMKNVLSVVAPNGFYLYFYGAIKDLTRLQLAGLGEAELTNTTLFKFAEELKEENADVEHCDWDKYVCSANNNENDDDEDLTNDLIRELCYFTGLKFYDFTKEFAAAVDEYTDAYEALSENLRRYLDDWKELDEDYFRNNFLNVDIYHKQLSVEEVIKRPAFEFLSLLGEIGGFLGLLLGASVLTVCEVVDFVVITATAAWASKRKTDDSSTPVKKIRLH